MPLYQVNAGRLAALPPTLILAAIAAVEAALLVQGVPVGCGGTRRAVMSLAGG